MCGFADDISDGSVVVRTLEHPGQNKSDHRGGADGNGRILLHHIACRCREFVEIYVATPLEECERRDVKGLYARARRGELRNFTGIDDPYEPPETPELTLDTRALSVEQCVAEVLARFEGQL